jgi:hypothetical protein
MCVYDGLAINPTIAKEPCRVYPIPIVNEPRVFVLGERTGQRVYPSGHMPSGGEGMTAGGMMPAIRVADKLSQHASQLDALNSRPLPERPPVVSY